MRGFCVRRFATQAALGVAIRPGFTQQLSASYETTSAIQSVSRSNPDQRYGGTEHGGTEGGGDQMAGLKVRDHIELEKAVFQNQFDERKARSTAVVAGLAFSGRKEKRVKPEPCKIDLLPLYKEQTPLGDKKGIYLYFTKLLLLRLLIYISPITTG